MISRYDQRILMKNVSSHFSEQFEKRGVNFIRHYSTFSIPNDAFEKSKGIIMDFHVWKLGDHLYKLAEQNYGDRKTLVDYCYF